jgi:hypothetical protein
MQSNERSLLREPPRGEFHEQTFRRVHRDFARSRSSFDDCLVERSEFELPVPVSKLSDDNVVL